MGLISDTPGFWVYLSLFAFFVYALAKERAFLGCPSFPNLSDCDNINGKAVKGTKPNSTDSVDVLFDKIKLAANVGDREVVWRRCIIFSFVAMIIYSYVIYSGFPPSYHLFCGILVISGVFYFSFSFYKFHLLDYIKRNIHEAVDLIKSKK